MVQIAAAICAVSWAVLGAGQALPIDLSEGWTFQTDGAWRIRCDHRDLLAMRHPWVPSKKGGFATALREVTIPEDWKGDVYLSFYCSDDYHTDEWRPDGSWLTAEGFIGHRMKQVLVDNRAVWSADVSDPVARGASPYYRIKLPVKPGRKFLLALLAFDAVDSETVLEDDFYQSANDKKKREEDPDASRFQTHIYWGDIRLLAEDAEPPPGKRPSEKRVRAVHLKRWPLPPFGDEWDGPVMLDISAPAGVPKAGFPARCGVPVHAGKIQDLTEVCLRTERKRSVFTQKAALGHWRDKSIQWVLFDFPVKPKLEKVELAFGPDKAGSGRKVKVAEGEDKVSVNAGVIQFDAAPAVGIGNVRLWGKPKVSSIALAVNVDGEDIPGTVDACTVTNKGPFRSTLVLQGRFDSLERSVGSYLLYCSAFADLPYLKLWFRLFNDTKTDLPVSGLNVRFTLEEDPSGLRTPSGEVEDGFVLEQFSEKSRKLNGAPADPLGPMFVAWKGGTVTVRHFRELFPKRASIKGNVVAIDLVAAGDSPVVFTPGEAKSHEIWLALGDVDPAQFAATVAQPPALQNAEHFCSTGAIGRAATHDGVPVLHEHMCNDFGDKRFEDLGFHFGVRHFPDSPYYGGPPKWSNNYYERMLGLWSEWFMSGDRAWYDLAFAVCRHLMDVAIVHSEVPGKDWLGAIHGPGENHVAAPWNPTLRIAGLALYHKLTGDPDARADFLGVADYCVRTRAGIGGDVRNQAGPFDAICTAYEETGEVEFLDDGAARVESALAAMDMRRGVWPDEHGSKVYRGNIPWMVAQVARPLYLWYHATGDIQAAQALVGLAESIVCENADWDQPGVVSGYSHNPHFDVSASYDLIILPVIFAAYELTEDPFFLDAAKAQWERWLRVKAFDSPLNCHWNTPWLMWYLKRYGGIEELSDSVIQ